MTDITLTLTPKQLAALGGENAVKMLVEGAADREIEDAQQRIRDQIVQATVAAIGALDETGTQKAIAIIGAIQADPTTVDRLFDAIVEA